jgi:hypothetical protein
VTITFADFTVDMVPAFATRWWDDVPTVKMLKAWNRNAGRPLRSFHLEVLAMIRAPACGPSATRSRRTWLRSVAAAPGGDPSRTASASASHETGALADSSRRASRARCRAPGTLPQPDRTFQADRSALHADATRIAHRTPILARRNLTRLSGPLQRA